MPFYLPLLFAKFLEFFLLLLLVLSSLPFLLLGLPDLILHLFRYFQSCVPQIIFAYIFILVLHSIRILRQPHKFVRILILIRLVE